MMGARPLPAELSTDDFPRRQLAAAWRRHMAVIYDGLDVAPAQDWGSASISRSSIGQIEAAAVRTDAQRVIRR